MEYESQCRKIFQGAQLEVEDLFLLEDYQIAYLRERAPQRELAAVLHAYPSVKRFFLLKCPAISDFIESLSSRFGQARNEEELAAFGDHIIWEIGEMVIYNKHPELYDERAVLGWDFADVTRAAPIEDRVVIDAGAGTGRVAFKAAPTARQVFAVEPNTSLRRFISETAKSKHVRNVYPIDGFLHAIPLPDGFADVLITSQAIGWHLEDELREIERVVRTGGRAVHLLGYPVEMEDDPLFSVLTSSKWQYECIHYEGKDGRKKMYTTRL